jgi:hypothetical protein
MPNLTVEFGQQRGGFLGNHGSFNIWSCELLDRFH